MTRKGWLAGVVAVGLAVALLPCAARAQDKVSRPAPEELRVQDMTDAELHQRLAEWEAGKRDDRDAYIILNQLRFYLRAQQMTGSPEFQTISKKRDDLLRKRPDLARLKDFRLSGRIRHQERAVAAQAALVQKAKKWTPSDSVPLRIVGNGKDAVAIYQFRLDFLRLGPEYELSPVPTAPSVFKLFRNGQEVPPTTIPHYKSLTHRHRFQVFPADPDRLDRILVCTDLLRTTYQAILPEERSMVQALGHKSGIPWTNKRGAIEQTCSILSIRGEPIFSFPVTQRVPDRLAAGIGMTKDGRKAAVMLGESVQLTGEYGTKPVIGKPREVLVWEEGKPLRRVTIKDSNLTHNDLLQQFAQGRF